ncbi:MAG: SRPBCC family protein [Desulfobacterales bacterium]
MLYRLERHQSLPIDMDDAWDFFSNPRNLRVITPPWLGLDITSELPDQIYPGLIITYTHRPLPWLTRPWVTEITHSRAPSYFVDEQRLGPFRFWHHRHRFRSAEGGIEMKDSIHYALPLGPAGRMAHSLVVRSRLEAIFDFRAEALRNRFPSTPQQRSSF